MNNIVSKSLVALLGGFLFLAINGCETPEFEERTNYQILIGDYIQENPDKYSTFYQVLEKTGTVSFLKAYGGYTCFAPDNSAFEAYLAQRGVASINDIPVNELVDLVKNHVIQDTLSSQTFVDGRLNTMTMYYQYLTTGTTFENGVVKLKVNKYAEVFEKDKRMSNGIVHGVKAVIAPVQKTVAQLIEENSQFSIFTEALKATTIFDTLMLDGAYTVIVVPNAAYEKEGINSFDQLKDKYSTLNDVSNPADSLYLYMAYHILKNNLQYMNDLVASKAVETMAPLEVLTIKAKSEAILINDDTFAGIYEPGYEIDKPVSDETAYNGVMHVSKADFNIKVRFPMRVYYEVTEQLEIQKMPGVFRRPGSTPIANGQLANITWHGDNNLIYYNAGLGGVERYATYLDRMDINLRPEVIKWIEFKTPILVGGKNSNGEFHKYKIWICTRNVFGANNRKAIFYVYFNDELMPVVINNQVTLNNTESEGALELRGWKLYSYSAADSLQKDRNYMSSDGAGRYNAQLAGTVEVKTTGIHTVKFVGISGTNGVWLDQIQFIPVEMDQLWPRVNVYDGSWVYKEDLDAGIYPQK
jgi:uncharacterized surface protein with fasciclin (FAS1) repeats